MKSKLLEMIDDIIAGNDDKAKESFSSYISSKTRELLEDQPGFGFNNPPQQSAPQQQPVQQAPAQIPSQSNVQPNPGTKERYLVQPLGLAYDDGEKACLVANANPKLNPTVLDTQTNKQVNWKGVVQKINQKAQATAQANQAKNPPPQQTQMGI